MSFGKRNYLLSIQTLLVFLIVNGTSKTKLAILVFLCCGEILRYSFGIVFLFIFFSVTEHDDGKPIQCIVVPQFGNKLEVEQILTLTLQSGDKLDGELVIDPY